MTKSVRGDPSWISSVTDVVVLKGLNPDPSKAEESPECCTEFVIVVVKLPLNCHELLPSSNPQFCTTLFAGGSTTSEVAFGKCGNSVLGSAP
jgi:hypothetical protein